MLVNLPAEKSDSQYCEYILIYSGVIYENMAYEKFNPQGPSHLTPSPLNPNPHLTAYYPNPTSPTQPYLSYPTQLYLPYPTLPLPPFLPYPILSPLPNPTSPTQSYLPYPTQLYLPYPTLPLPPFLPYPTLPPLHPPHTFTLSPNFPNSLTQTQRKHQTFQHLHLCSLLLYPNRKQIPHHILADRILRHSRSAQHGRYQVRDVGGDNGEGGVFKIGDLVYNTPTGSIFFGLEMQVERIGGRVQKGALGIYTSIQILFSLDYSQ